MDEENVNRNDAIFSLVCISLYWECSQNAPDHRTAAEQETKILTG